MHELWGSPLAPLIFVAFFGSVGVLLFPLMQGLRHRIEGNGGEAMERLRDEVHVLRAEVEHLRTGAMDEATRERLSELEERVDFAERLVTRGLPPGSQGGA
jgi:cell division protein FtsB